MSETNPRVDKDVPDPDIGIQSHPLPGITSYFQNSTWYTIYQTVLELPQTGKSARKEKLLLSVSENIRC